MSNDKIIATLTKLASATKSRKTFNQSVAKEFGTKLGSGAFRVVYAAGDTVIKLRRHSPRNDGRFDMDRINPSNQEESDAYSSFEDAIMAHFILKPTYVALPNGHDAILMDKVDFVWGELDWDEQMEYAKKNPKIHDQIQIINEVFQDGHDHNVGVKGDRAYLIDFNLDKTWKGMMKSLKPRARKVLESVGVKFKGRKPKVKLLAAEAGT